MTDSRKTLRYCLHSTLATTVLIISLHSFDSAAQSLQQFPSPAEIDYRALRLPWNSTNRNADELSNQLESLYLLLYNNGNLPVTWYTLPDSRTISEAAFDLGIVKGGHFPRGIDALLCDLNPHVCRRDKAPVETPTGERAEKNVGGFTITPGNWWISPGDAVRIVDLDLKSDIKFVSRTIPEGETVLGLLEKERVDCTSFGAPCIDIVRKLNPYFGSFERPYSGSQTAVMPVERVSAMIPIKDQSVAESLRDRYALYVDEEEATQRAVEYAGPDITNSAYRLDEVVQSIDDNLYRKRPKPPTLILNGNFDNLHGESLSLYELTRHPFRRKQGSIDDLSTVSIAVGVIDYWVDTNHCHLAGRVKLVGPLGQRQVARAANCYDVAAAVSEIESHGTHIVGTIVGGSDGGKFIGLYPQADLHFSVIEPDALGDALETEPTEMNIFMMSQTRDVRVVNLSWEYYRIGNNDPIMRGIDAFVNTTLFVAASGNSAKSMDRDDPGCIWDPACQSNNRYNVMSVVGLTSSVDHPDVYEKDNAAANGSNYGTAFDIGATGQGVLSAVNGDRVGKMSGTSQAAPQVTASAALVLARFKETRPAQYQSLPPSPAQLKNRLMYTADVFPHLLDSLYSGRLNIERALAINEVRVVFDDNPDTVIRARIVNAPSMIVCRVSGTDKNIAWDALRRIAPNDLSNSLVVFYEELDQPDQPQTARLKRITDCDLRSQSNPISVTNIDTNEDIQRQMKDIVDITMRF